MVRLELGAIQFEAEFKNGELVYGSPRIDILQDNIHEIAAQVPDGRYKWVTVLDINKAEKVAGISIQQMVDRGWVECPKCSSRLLVSATGDVMRCTACGDNAPAYWNLFIQTH